MVEQITFDAFWLNYLRAHSKRLTRLIHYTGITIIHAGIVAALWLSDWRIAASGIAVGYVTAWAAHLTVQHNEPVMFKSPKWALWSLFSGLRMYYLALVGRIGPELKRSGVSV